MSFTERLNEAMKIRNFTQEKLAQKVGMAQSSVWKLTSGESKSTRKLLEIATALRVSPEWLWKGEGEMNVTHAKEPSAEYICTVNDEKLIKVKGEAIMGADGAFEMDENFNGYLKFYSNDPNAFALKVKGDSMFPRINSGEFVVLEPKVMPCSGDEVLVRTKDGKNMIKKLEFCRDGIYRFTSINQDHPPITLDEDLVDVIVFVSAIVKNTRYMDLLEI